jgi:hypothetical protein
LFASGIGGILRNVRPKSGSLILGILLALQLTDISQGVWQLRQKLSHAKPWSSPLKSDFWSTAGKRYKAVVVTLPAKHYDRYVPLAHFAVTHGMSTNAVYLARVDQAKLSEARDFRSSSVRESAYQPDELYICGEEQVWKTLSMRPESSEIDGYLVISPDVKP